METKLKQISLRIDAKQLKEMKQYCLDNDTNMTTAIKAGLFLLKHSTQEGDKTTVSVDTEALKEYTGIEL